MTREEVLATAAVDDRRGHSVTSVAVMLSAVAVSFVLIALLVVTSSQAAFTAATTNTGNSASTATLTLSDDDSGTAMFDGVTGLVPGTPVERCIRVTYVGGVDPAPVRLYAPGPVTGDLAPYLTLTVDVGPDSGGPYSSCAGFTATGGHVYDGLLGGVPTTYDTGLTTWDPVATGETRTFRFRLVVTDDTAAQDKSATFGFTWESRSS